MNPEVDVELDEIDLEECIGRGGHGNVYKVSSYYFIIPVDVVPRVSAGRLVIGI